MPRSSMYSTSLSLEAALDACLNGDDLRKLVKLIGRKPPTRKADMAAVIVGYLEGDGLRRLWDRLDERQRAAVAEVVHSDSCHFAADLFAAKYGADPDWGEVDRYGHVRQPSLLALLFYGGMMPEDLRTRCREFVPEPIETVIDSLPELPGSYDVARWDWDPQAKKRVQRVTEVPIAAHHTETRAQRELLAVLRLVDAGKIPVGAKTQRPSAASMRAVTEVLDGDDYYAVVAVDDPWYDENAGPIRAFAWPVLVHAGGLARISGSKLALTEAGRSALLGPPADALRRLWTKWLESSHLDELSRVECIKGQTGMGKRELTAVSPRRISIAIALAECPVARWVGCDDFLRFMCATGNRLDVARSAWNLYLSEKRYGSLGGQGAKWLADERYLLAFLLEYAATLGVIDVGLIPPAGARPDYHHLWGADHLAYFSRYDGLVYFRITPLGAYCLGLAESYEPARPPSEAVLSVLPNLEIAALGAELSQADRIALDSYATRVSDLVWRLDRSGLLSALDRGRPIEDLRAFLEARSDGEIPGTVASLLDDVAARGTRIRDCGQARLVECDDPALAALIAHDSRTRKLCMPVGEKHLAVPASREAAFLRALRGVGYLVAAGAVKPSDAPGDPSGNKASRGREA